MSAQVTPDDARTAATALAFASAQLLGKLEGLGEFAAQVIELVATVEKMHEHNPEAPTVARFVAVLPQLEGNVREMANALALAVAPVDELIGVAARLAAQLPKLD